MGILDYDTPGTLLKISVPKFIKIAKRQARSRKDHGQHTPTRKFLRLGNRQDTEDVVSVLRDWREGTIKPVSDTSTGSRLRPVLSERSNNIQRQPRRSYQEVLADHDGLIHDREVCEAQETSIDQSLKSKKYYNLDCENRGSETELPSRKELHQAQHQQSLPKARQAPRKKTVQKRQEDARPSAARVARVRLVCAKTQSKV